jgi:Ca2+-binding EF-hand superfamily protein
MKKILAVLFACSIVLAGCMDLTDEDVDAIVDAIVEIPGCNADETAYNYDVNATNNNACLTETILKDSITDFINLMDNGPGADQTMGMSMSGSGDMEGQQMDWTSVNAYSPSGVYSSMDLDLEIMVWSQSQLITAAADGTILMQVDWNGESMLMTSVTQYSSWKDNMEMNDDDDMDMGEDMGLPDISTPEVELPDDFDPSNALFVAGLATDNGYAFSTTMDDGEDYSMTMTFTLGMDLVVSSMTMTETMGGESSTSSVTMLDDVSLMGYLTIDATLPYQALPFGTSPMGGMDGSDDDHDDHDEDDVYWESYNGGYCEWEGNSDDGEDVWSCKLDESDNDWDTWWYYCELHEGDWHCTDDFGQSSGHENSAYLDEYDAHAGHDDDHDDDLITPEQLLADIDSDESGTMSLDEFNAFFGGSNEIDINDPEFSEIFDNNDADASGDLDNNELEGFIMELDAYLEGGHDEDDHDDDDEYDDDFPSESEMFSGMDVDQDGNVTLTEASDYFNQMMNDAPTPEDAMEDADYDDSGNVSWNEFVINWNEYEDEDDSDDYHLNNSQDLGAQLHEAFNNSDDDANGGLDLSELQDFIDQVVVITEALEEDDEDDDEFMSLVNSAFACTDYNTDNMLDSDEFSEYYNGIFGGMNVGMMLCYMDLDLSGEVSASEFAQWANQSDDSEPMSDEDWNDFVYGFDMMDTDGSGGLNLDELTVFMFGDFGDGGTFMCDNGGEVPGSFVDDGDNDCGDWSDEPNYSDNGDDGHGDHGSMFDWMIANTQADMPMEGSFDDYSIVLAMCDMDESGDDDMGMGMGEAPSMLCGDDIMKISIADAMAEGAVVMFHDADMSGTISSGDMVHISPDIDVDGDWNMVRLYSTSADSYSDENPMLTPGFSSMIGIVALLGAALLTRRD